MDLESYFKSFYAGTKNPSLAVMEYFVEEFNHPEKDLEIIHIAGTNGKGSIAEMMSNILTKAGYKTGKFMSPHLIRYNERMSINNENITDKELEELVLKVIPKVENYHKKHTTKVTLFELETILALLYFSQNNCDFVVLETGLGGLYDCTNIVNAQLSIISSIGYDHMNLLGNTLLEIAEQKAGIIKASGDTIAVKQENEVNEVIQKTCQEKGSTLHWVDPKEITNLSYQDDLTSFCYQRYTNLQIPLRGLKQPQNAVICLVRYRNFKT